MTAASHLDPGRRRLFISDLSAQPAADYHRYPAGRSVGCLRPSPGHVRPAWTRSPGPAAGQAKLKQAQVLLVGAGGLGAPLGMYLAAAGWVASVSSTSMSSTHRISSGKSHTPRATWDAPSSRSRASASPESTRTSKSTSTKRDSKHRTRSRSSSLTTSSRMEPTTFQPATSSMTLASSRENRTSTGGRPSRGPERRPRVARGRPRPPGATKEARIRMDMAFTDGVRGEAVHGGQPLDSRSSFTHIPLCTTCFRLRGRPRVRQKLPEEEWPVERDSGGIAEMLNDNGQMKLALKLAGRPITDREAGPSPRRDDPRPAPVGTP